MRASHKKRLARLVAPLDYGEQVAVDDRDVLRTDAAHLPYVRAAMEGRGLDPAAWPMFRDVEEAVANFVDTPELQAADEAFNAKYQKEEDRLYWEDQARKTHAWLARVAEKYMDGHLPSTGCSFLELLAWAIAQEWRARDAAADDAAPTPPQ
jgi:hypothetical protein